MFIYELSGSGLSPVAVSNKCDSVKQIRGTCKSLESPVKFKIFFTNPRIFKRARNVFVSEDLYVNKFFSFLFSDIHNAPKLNDLV